MQDVAFVDDTKIKARSMMSDQQRRHVGLIEAKADPVSRHARLVTSKIPPPIRNRSPMQTSVSIVTGKEVLGRSDLAYGIFGENLTVDGLSEFSSRKLT